jgi:hypothetical protein
MELTDRLPAHLTLFILTEGRHICDTLTVSNRSGAAWSAKLRRSQPGAEEVLRRLRDAAARALHPCGENPPGKKFCGGTAASPDLPLMAAMKRQRLTAAMVA